MRFFSSDNMFTRLMNRIGLLVTANLLFLLCCIPVVTAGAGFAALYYTMLRALREGGDIKPVKTFWHGLKENARQAAVVWLALLAAAVLMYLEIFWCQQFSGPVRLFRYGLYAIALVLAVLAVYVFPVMGAFRCTLPQLMKNSIGFAVQNPIVTLMVLFLNVAPMAWTFFTDAYLPLYAFLWCTIGFSGITMLCAKMMLPQFQPYLSDEDHARSEAVEKSNAQLLQELGKLDG